MSDGRKRILFICTHNAGRSQMAEGLVNALFSDKLDARSAGVSPSPLNPLAVRVMGEAGIDISKQRSKHLDELEGERFDIVVTLCTEDETTCPFFPAQEHMHHGFADPSRVSGTEEQQLQAVRAIRDDIRAWIKATFIG
jgi:arsenate reductase (thioredoxin)